jgi:hypothetical protein
MSTPIAADFSAIAASMKTHTGNPDAELIRRCHQFAEADLASWYRYVLAACNGEDADAQDTPADVDGYNWITATPATTREGWHAKALALSAWDRTAYFNDEPEESDGTTLLASLLQDMVAPERNAILAKLATQYGPLPEQYTSEGRWLVWSKSKAAADPVEPTRGNLSAAAQCKESAPNPRRNGCEVGSDGGVHCCASSLKPGAAGGRGG